MLSKGPQTAVVMCKYYAIKGAPNRNCNVKFPDLKKAANSTDLINCVGYLLEVFAIRYVMNCFLLLHIFQTTSVNAR